MEGFRKKLWPAGRKLVVLMHGNAKFLPRQQSDGDIIFFTQGDVEVEGKSEKRVNAKLDCKLMHTEFHEYTLVFPLPGVKVTEAIQFNAIYTNTFDENVSNYVYLHSNKEGIHVVPAGTPIARLTLDCCPQAGLVPKKDDDLSRLAVETDGGVYKTLDACHIANVSWPLSSFRSPQDPAFDWDRQAHPLEAVMHEKSWKFKVIWRPDIKYKPSRISVTDMILYAQEHTTLRYGENRVKVGGIQIDSCEPLCIEYPLHGTPLANKSAVRREKIERMQDIWCLKIMYYEKTVGLIKAGEPVARVWSTFRTHFSSLQFNSTLYAKGAAAAIDMHCDDLFF